MSDTFGSTVDDFLKNGNWLLGSYTMSLVATTHFWKIVATVGASTFTLQDSNLNSGVTSPTLKNLWLSWCPPGRTVPYVNSMTLDGNGTWQFNHFQSIGRLFTALATLLVQKCSDFLAVASGALSAGASNALASSQVSLLTVTSTLNPGYTPIYRMLFIYGALSSTDVGDDTTLNLGVVRASPITNMRTLEGNWGRVGMVVPDLGVSDDIVKIQVLGVNCSQEQGSTALLAPTSLPLTWLSGAFDSYWFCPESRDIIYTPQD